MKNKIIIDGVECLIIDEWEETSENLEKKRSFIIGNDIKDPDFYYVQSGSYYTWYDYQPDREKAMGDYYSYESMLALDYGEKLYGADGVLAFGNEEDLQEVLMSMKADGIDF